MKQFEGLRNDSRNSIGGPFLGSPFDPQEVDDVTLAFPAQIGWLLPDPADIPDEFWAGGTPWNDFASHWFFQGLPEDTKAYMKPGRDGATCFRHLQAIKGSFQPKHQHKEAALAFLASQWMYAVEAPSLGKTWGEIPDEVEDDEEQQP